MSEESTANQEEGLNFYSSSETPRCIRCGQPLNVNEFHWCLSVVSNETRIAIALERIAEALEKTLLPQVVIE